MQVDVVEAISSHAILVLLLQLTALLALARVLAELMRRVGQPAVIGELLAGIVLGPTVLGHFAPDLFIRLFPQEVSQFHLLEVVSWLGMVLLLLLTGLETDLRVVRSMGRAALMASVFGMVVPFAAGMALGWTLPDRFLADPGQRGVFAAFIATAMAISALPVIAKILIDLDLIKRDVGVVILSAGVVDDTTGWLVLSIIAGVATAGTFSPGRLGLTLGALAGFLAVARWVAYPLFERLLRYVYERVALTGADLTLILCFTFVSAAATEAIGVHAVFGGFVMGLLVRQVPRVKAASLRTLETFVLALLSPIFFAYVGLKVDLWALRGWGLPLGVLAVAVAGKMVGCYAGGRLGRMPHWQALALGFGMNARGGMGLIVALIGLSLGLLTQEMFATIVLVAVVTSFMAPLLLKAVLSKLAMTDAERARLEAGTAQRFLPAGPPRILVPTAGGANAMAAFAIAAPWVATRQGRLTALYVESIASSASWLGRLVRRPTLAGRGVERHLEEAAALLGDQRKLLVTKRVVSADPVAAILAEAARDYDFLLLGAAPHHSVGGRLVAEVVRSVRVPRVVVRRVGGRGPGVFKHVVVPVDGSLFARCAVEFAFAYAHAAHAHVTLLHVINETRLHSGLTVPGPDAIGGVGGAWEETLAARVREDFAGLAAGLEIAWSPRLLVSDDTGGTIIDESQSGHFDLLVLGAENKLLAQPLFFGQGTASIVERAGCTTAVVIPHLE